MKIAVCSLYINDWYRDITKYGKLSLENYCTKFGYDFYFETENTENSVYDGQREFPWYKIKLISKLLATGQYDYIVWNDADSVVVRDKYTFEDIIRTHMEDKDLLVAKDWNSTLNTGTMFIKNTEWSRNLMDRIWTNPDEFEAGLHEQASLGQLYLKNEMEEQNRIKVLPGNMQNLFLTYWFMYDKNTFIRHATRCAHDRAGFIFTMDGYIPFKIEEETEEQFQNRIDWLENETRYKADIEHYRNGGIRRNLPARYISYLAQH